MNVTYLSNAFISIFINLYFIFLNVSKAKFLWLRRYDTV